MSSTAVSIDDVRRLSSVTTYPCVTVLLTTEPGSRMSANDERRLDALIAEAEDRLRSENSPETDEITASLSELARELHDRPTDRSVALFAARHHAEVRHLPVAVEDRVVVDPTFATRDLVNAVQQHPTYTLLALTKDGARLFTSRRGSLTEVKNSMFPMRERTDRASRIASGRRARREPVSQARADELLRTRLKEVARRLEVSDLGTQTPLVVMGQSHLLSQFRAVSGLTDGTIYIRHSFGRTTWLRTLERAVRPVLERYLDDVEAAAHDTVTADLPGRATVNGLAASWHAARHHRPELLVVERSFAQPARVMADGEYLLPATDTEHPEVTDDAVDELIELVIAKGGHVQFVADGSLADHESVALRVVLDDGARRRGRRRREASATVAGGHK